MNDWECVIVDDGSTDETARVAAEMAASDRRIRVARIPHSGHVGALNAGLDHCVGEWIQVLDDDDWLHEDKLRFQLECAARKGIPEGPAILYGDYVVVARDEDGRETWKTQVVGDQTVRELLLGMLHWNGGSDAPLRQGSSLVRRSAFEATRFDPRLNGFVDTKLYVDLLLRDLPFIYTPFAGYHQYIHGANYTSDGSRTRREYLEYLEVLSRTVPELVAESPRFGLLAYCALRDRDRRALRLLLRIGRRTRFSARWMDGVHALDFGPPIRFAAQAGCPPTLLPLLVRVFLGVERRIRRATARHQIQPR